MLLLAPSIEETETLPNGFKHKYQVPIYEKYAVVIQRASKDTKASKAHREKLFGTDLEFSMPDIYQEIEIAHECHMSYPEFLATDIHIRAKLIARYRLSSMVELVKRDREIIAENNKKHLGTNAAGQQSQEQKGNGKTQ